MAPAKRHSDFIRNPRSSISRPPISGHAAPTRSRDSSVGHFSYVKAA